MKRILLTLAAVWIAAWSLSASVPQLPLPSLDRVDELSPAARRELLAELQQRSALEEAYENEVVRSLDLTDRQRRRFEKIYREYRAALDSCTRSEVACHGEMSDAELLRYLKVRLQSIADAAAVKRTYVDRFATVLSAEQIRAFYNTEGRLSADVRAAASAPYLPTDLTLPHELIGSGNLVTKTLAVGSYHAVEACSYTKVVLDAAAKQATVTADDNVMPYVRIRCENGVVHCALAPTGKRGSFTLDNLHITVTLPASDALNSLDAVSHGSIVVRQPLTARDLKIRCGTYGRIEAPSIHSAGALRAEVSSHGKLFARLEADGEASLLTGSYGRFQGGITAAKVTLEINAYASFAGGVTSRGDCSLTLSTRGRLEGPIVCRRLRAAASGYGTATGAVTAPDGIWLDISSRGIWRGDLRTEGDLTLSVSGYAGFSGTVRAAGDTRMAVTARGSVRSASFTTRGLKAEVSGYAVCGIDDLRCGGAADFVVSARGSFSGGFAARSFTADVSGYGAMTLSGSAEVESGCVRATARGSFRAPNLRVGRYDRLEASGYGAISVRRSETQGQFSSSNGLIRME